MMIVQNAARQNMMRANYYAMVRKASWFDPRFTATVQPISEGAAVAVVPVGQPIIPEELREALVDVVRQTLAAGHEPHPGDDCSVADAMTIVAFPVVLAGFVYVMVAAIADAEDAAVWAVAALLIVAILVRKPLRQAARKLGRNL